jgi:hypothetical protein
MARAALDCIDPLLSNPTAQLNTKLDETRPFLHIRINQPGIVVMKNNEFLTFSEVIF